MTGFGDKLRREREMRGVSLDEISESTKIGTRNLRALEEEDFDKLPGGIFNKGFVRAYSRFLGLNEEQTVSDFEASLKEHQVSQGQAAEPPPEEESGEDRSSLLWLAVAALVLIAVSATAWYLLRQGRATLAEERQPQTVATSTLPGPQPSPAPSSTGPAPDSISASQDASAKAASTGTSSKTNSDGNSAPTPQAAQQTSTSDLPPGSTAPIRLEVTAHEDSWLSVSADGKSLGQEILVAQKSRTIHAQREVRLKLGNVAGVEVSFNGRPINIDGEPKQVKELTFTADGLRR